MAGLLSSYLGNNDAYKWLDQNRNSLAQGFAGITGATSFGDGAKGAAYGLLNGAQTDQANQKLAQSKIDDQAKIQKAADALRNQWNRPDLADAVINGGFGLDKAWDLALTKQEAPKPMEINGQLVDPTSGRVLGDYRSPEAPPSPPSGYQWQSDNTLAPIKGGPQDPNTQAPKGATDAQRRANSILAKTAPELQRATENWDELANGGQQALNMNVPFTDFRPGAAMTSGNYQVAADAVATIAQNYLYAISGQAAPEGEVKRIVESVTPGIGDSPQRSEAKKQRLQELVNSIQLLANGQIDPATLAQQEGLSAPVSSGAPQIGGTTTSGLQWSVTQ